jgi:hypothetical protein
VAPRQAAVPTTGFASEVEVCLDRARFLYRRAAARCDEASPFPGREVPLVVQSVRDLLIERGWRAAFRLSGVLRWVDRLLPWSSGG